MNFRTLQAANTTLTAIEDAVAAAGRKIDLGALSRTEVDLVQGIAGALNGLHSAIRHALSTDVERGALHAQTDVTTYRGALLDAGLRAQRGVLDRAIESYLSALGYLMRDSVDHARDGCLPSIEDPFATSPQFNQWAGDVVPRLQEFVDSLIEPPSPSAPAAPGD